MLQTSTLRPGLLVAVKTSLVGGINYTKETIESDTVTATGAKRAKWETTRTIADPDEHDRATKVLSKARSIISGLCAKSAFGYLCPETDAEDLEKAIGEARGLCDAFNATAKLARARLYVMTGRIAPDDVEAMKAINAEVRELLASMETGVKNMDVEVIRDAARRAKQLGSMLTPDAQARLTQAIEAVRTTAKTIVKAGETAALELDKKAIRALTEARGAFLDLDEATNKPVEQPDAQARALDFEPVADVAPVGPTHKPVQLDLEAAIEIAVPQPKQRTKIEID